MTSPSFFHSATLYSIYLAQSWLKQVPRHPTQNQWRRSLACKASAGHNSLSEADLHGNGDTNRKPENTHTWLDVLTASAPINGHASSVGLPPATAK